MDFSKLRTDQGSAALSMRTKLKEWCSYEAFSGADDPAHVHQLTQAAVKEMPQWKSF